MPRGAVKADAEVVRAARRFGAGIAEVWVDGRGDVQVELVEEGKVRKEGNGRVIETAREEDVALVLHTSGTTGRPKAVGFFLL